MMDTNLDIDSEKSNGMSRETSIILLTSALVVSCIVHIVLMIVCADCAFAPLPGDVKRDRKWTKELPVMKVRKMDADPYNEIKAEIARPAAAPDNEKQEERVERLAKAAKSDIAPEMPTSASAIPVTESIAEPTAVDAESLKPREQIMAIESPVVPDELAALPRIIIPKVDRVKGASDITPAYDLIAEPSSAQVATPVAPAPISGAADIDVMPIPVAASFDTFGATQSAIDRPNASQALSEADRKRAEDRAAKAAELLNAEKKPVPPAPKSIMIDEKVVESAKEAVRSLRDDTTEEGREFHENVSVSLASYVDPRKPKYKYFRINISSRAEKPLPVVAKDMVFLLDASGSIGNDRLKSCKKAILSALRFLNTGDRFNIVAFRDKFTFAFPETAWCDVTENSLEAADKWLSRLTAHGQTDVFRTLRGVMAMPRDPTRPVVALVVTDGDATSGMTRNAEIISKFSELNGGLISMFMYGVKENANAYLMDMLTRSNRGSWSRHEGMRWRAAAGIPDLATKFQRPVLSDISVIFSASSRAQTYPQLVQNLCEDAPVEIYGRCPADQKDIVFSLRGLNGAMVFESMFRLPLEKAKTLDEKLRDSWANQRLYALIAEYTSSRDIDLLKEIRSFAAEYKLSVPYENEIRK